MNIFLFLEKQYMSIILGKHNTAEQFYKYGHLSIKKLIP